MIFPTSFFGLKVVEDLCKYTSNPGNVVLQQVLQRLRLPPGKRELQKIIPGTDQQHIPGT